MKKILREESPQTGELDLEPPQTLPEPRSTNAGAAGGSERGPGLLALDASLTCTGWARSDGMSGVLSTPTLLRGEERMQWIRSRVLELLPGVDVVLIEGPAFASRGRAVVDLGGLHWVLRLALRSVGVRVVVVPPSVRSKFATGRGNASKHEVLAAAIRRLGYTGHDHNVSDALWLLQLGLHRYRLPLSRVLPASHLTALDSVNWPADAPARFDAAGFAAANDLEEIDAGH